MKDINHIPKEIIVETVILLSMIVFAVQFLVAKSKDEREENGPEPSENYEEMIREMNEHRISIGAEPIRTIRRK